MQPSSSNSISVPDVRGDFNIYIVRQSATLTKISKWCFVWQYEYGSLPLLKSKFFFKNTCSTIAAWIHVGLLYSKSEMIYLPKKVCLIIIHRNTTHLPDMSCCNKHQQDQQGIIMKILKYVCSHYMYTLYVCWYTFSSNKRHCNYVWRCYHTLPNSTNMNSQ